MNVFLNSSSKGKSTRDGYGEGLLRLGHADERVLVLDADLCRSTRTEWWAKEFPDRFFNCGIAEQNMIGVASGLASCGFIPFATTYSIFVARAFDQIRQSVAYGKQNVKIVGCHAGFAASFDGGSHQGLEDLALMRVLPGMTVLSPLDAQDAAQAVELAAAITGPVYLRIQKEETPFVTLGEPPLACDRTLQWGNGTDLALIGTGSRVGACLEAAARLEADGHRIRVLGIGCLKPLDRAALLETASEVGTIVTVEEHMQVGGLHEAVCAAVTGSGCPVHAIGADDQFGETGSWHELLSQFRLDASGVRAVATTSLSVGRVHRRLVASQEEG